MKPIRLVCCVLGTVLLLLPGVAVAHDRDSAAAGSDSVLLGVTTVRGVRDSKSAGIAEAFPYAASVSGTITDAHVYVTSGSAATSLIVGVYNNYGGKPRRLL